LILFCRFSEVYIKEFPTVIPFTIEQLVKISGELMTQVAIYGLVWLSSNSLLNPAGALKQFFREK
jgi:hypothetical protein